MKTTVGSLRGFVFAKAVIMTFLLGCSASASIQAQIEVPKAVQATFDELFPAAEEVFWLPDDKIYLANFYDGERSKETSIDKSGVWVQTFTYLNFEELPKGALDFIQREFGQLGDFYTIAEVEKKELRFFSASFEWKDKEVYLEFDSNGKVLKKEITPPTN